MIKKKKGTWKKPIIKHGKMTKYNYIVQYPEKLKLGKNFDIGTFTYINSHYGVEIGNNVQIGSHCSIYSHSTIDRKKGPVILKNNCKIGSHSVILPGVRVGENSIVGAFSLVKDDIPANVVAVGIPARVIRKLNTKY